MPYATAAPHRHPATGTATGTVDVRFFAAARAVAGTDATVWDLLPGESVGDLLARHGLAGDPVLARCSYLLDGVTADVAARPTAGGTLDVLPPFAGG